MKEYVNFCLKAHFVIVVVDDVVEEKYKFSCARSSFAYIRQMGCVARLWEGSEISFIIIHAIFVEKRRKVVIVDFNLRSL